MIFPRISEVKNEPNGLELKTSPVNSPENPFNTAKGGKNGAITETLINNNVFAEMMSKNRKFILLATSY